MKEVKTIVMEESINHLRKWWRIYLIENFERVVERVFRRG